MSLETEFRPLYLTLPSTNIVFLKFLLETYEGIAEIRTLSQNEQDAQIVILALKDTLPAVENLLNQEKESINWEFTTDLPNFDNDWLLKFAKEV
jgi:hypothetical protein